MTKKKLLMIVDWFSPGYKAGGPIQSCVNLAHALKEEYDIYVLTSDTDHGETTPYPLIQSNRWNDELFPGFHIYYINAATFNKKSLPSLINSVGAEFIYLNHLYSPFFVVRPLWLKWLKKINGRIVLCPRGALHPSAVAEKSYKKLPFIFLMKLLRMAKFIRFHATNEKESKEIAHYFPGSEVCIANNLPGVEQPQLKIIPKIKGELKCVFFSRIVPIKNLLFLLEMLHKMPGKLKLVIGGPIEDAGYWNICQRKIKALPSSISVEYVGSVRKEQIEELLSGNHLSILPTMGENFGHSIFESFVCGRPVLISDRTPWTPSPEKKTGWALPLEKPQLFIDAVETAAGWDQKEFEEYATSSWNFAHQFIHNPQLVEPYKFLFS